MSPSIAVTSPDDHASEALAPRPHLALVKGDRLAAHYRELFGWHVEHNASGTFLGLRHDMVAISVPTMHNRAARVLELLQQRDSRGPVLEIHTRSRRWLFLADANGLVLAQCELPEGVELIGCTHVVPLPSAASRAVRWIIPPAVQRRWLPTLAAVVGATHEVATDNRAALG